MKLKKLLIIVLSLLLSIPTYACWGDDWDDGYDDSYDDGEDWDELYGDLDSDDYSSDLDWGQSDDIWGGMLDGPEIWGNSGSDNVSDSDDDSKDYAWSINLPDVTVFPGNGTGEGSETGDDWWRRDTDDSDKFGNGDEEEPDNDGNPNTGHWNDSDKKDNVQAPDFWKNQTWHVPASNEFVLNWNKWEYLPEKWLPQDKNNNCVSTVLEYVVNYLNNTLNEDNYATMHHAYEAIFVDMYGIDLGFYGVHDYQMLAFFQNCGFNACNINYSEIASCILSNIPVVGTLKGSDNWAHECFIIGYFEGEDKFSVVNPWGGTIETVDKSAFYGNAFYSLTNSK